ncbi:phosphonate metabolism transcriptional regulator PhnF (plasmid) [Mesorhizobium sp. AR07]|uniref:phosphonate metabolism transcriptional regulator PhnF n=1 Tax=Mesorhizobium sp. AR07 TaxID=2865838 RepID=UPI00215FE919|nr:phosphonate metabolism transcriptional regulator PhnF [Mesorhizobium sp. AR07]UVK48171.1 phosphonate metabolism transcriptional regulator PhnF [Mesorhizobium sp. AR07]
MEKKLRHGQWQEVESALAEDILTGLMPPKAQVPTETDLMQRFEVGRHTVRRAVASLEHRGLVQVERGRGTFVRDARLDYRLSDRTRFSQNLLDQGREPVGQAIHEEVIAASAAIAEALRLPVGEPVYHIVRLGFADEEPINYSHAFYPVQRFPGFDEARRSGRSVTHILAEYGVPDYLRLRTDLIIRLPTAEEARQLSQSISQPVVVTKKIDVDLKGVPVAYSESVWPGERVQFSIDNTSKLLDILARNSND